MRLFRMCFLFAALAPVFCAAGETPMTVMTFNLRYGTASDGKFSWEHRKELLVETIRKADPVLLGVQECLAMQSDYLLQTLPEYKMIGRGRNADGGGEMAAIFYKESELEPVESGFFWLSKKPDVPGSRSWDTSDTRIVTHAAFVHKASGKKLYYYNTHFDHRGKKAREKSAEMIAKRIAQLPSDANVLITGDFNALGGIDKPWHTLVDAGLQDAWLAATERKGPEATFTGFQPRPRDPKERIDWIFTRGAARINSCETVVVEKNGLYPSDHYPVVAKMVWPF